MQIPVTLQISTSVGEDSFHCVMPPGLMWNPVNIMVYSKLLGLLGRRKWTVSESIHASDLPLHGTLNRSGQKGKRKRVSADQTIIAQGRNGEKLGRTRAATKQRRLVDTEQMKSHDDQR